MLSSHTWESIVSCESPNTGKLTLTFVQNAIRWLTLSVISKAYSPTIPVGHQRYYKSSWDALRQIYAAEGVKGYFRGVDAAMLRTGMGSMVRLHRIASAYQTSFTRVLCSVRRNFRVIITPNPSLCSTLA
jgi:hypothetical protein